MIVSCEKFTTYPYNCNVSQALFETSQFREESDVDFDKREMLRTTGPGTHFNSRLGSCCGPKNWGAGLWAGLLSCYCQLELEVTITDVVNLWQSPSSIM